MTPAELQTTREGEQLKLDLQQCLTGPGESELLEEVWPGCVEGGHPPLNIINLVLRGGRLPQAVEGKSRRKMQQIFYQTRNWS